MQNHINECHNIVIQNNNCNGTKRNKIKTKFTFFHHLIPLHNAYYHYDDVVWVLSINGLWSWFRCIPYTTAATVHALTQSFVDNTNSYTKTSRQPHRFLRRAANIFSPLSDLSCESYDTRCQRCHFIFSFSVKHKHGTLQIKRSAQIDREKNKQQQINRGNVCNFVGVWRVFFFFNFMPPLL